MSSINILGWRGTLSGRTLASPMLELYTYVLGTAFDQWIG